MIAFTLTETDQKSNIAVVNNEGGDFRFITDNNFRSFYPFWSPDGKSIMFSSRHDTNNEDDEIYRIFLNGNDPLRITQWPKHNFCASWSTDGEKIAYVTSMENTRPEIYIMNANGENQIRITFNEEGDTLPHWSPDNKKLLITGFRNDNYEIVELDVSDIIR
jgi:TolB protein